MNDHEIDAILRSQEWYQTPPAEGSCEDAVRGAIVAWLKYKRVNKSEVARRLGVSPSNVSQMLSGKRALSLKNADRILSTVGLKLSFHIILKPPE